LSAAFSSQKSRVSRAGFRHLRARIDFVNDVLVPGLKVMVTGSPKPLLRAEEALARILKAGVATATDVAPDR
jgi:hypothetical protein